MQKITNSILVLILVVAGQISTHAQNQNVMDIISNSPNHTVLTSALQSQNLDIVLANPMNNYTVFAPTDNAFSDLLTALGVSQQQLLANPDLRDILLYHVVGSTVLSSDLSNGMKPATENNNVTVKISVLSNGVFVNQAQVTTPDLTANNGVVHVTNEVLLPGSTVVDVIIDNQLDLLANALFDRGLVPTLSNPFASFTVFAPLDAGISSAINAFELDQAFLNSDDFTDFLLYHVVDEVVRSTDLEDGTEATPLYDENTLKITLNNGVFINQAFVTDGNLDATNGVVHIIDEMLVPIETPFDLLNEDFSILKTAIITAKLTPVIVNPQSNLTVFAPTNDAFNSLLEAFDLDTEDLLELPNLDDILLYHVLNGVVSSSDLENGMIVENDDLDQSLKISINADGNVYINHAMVTTADVEADNGIVHVINEVLVLTESVLDVAIDNDFSTLTTAVFAADLAPALCNPFSDLTVFAPTNEAFENLATALDVTIEDLLELDNLQDILLYHVVEGSVFSTDLENGSVTTLNGNDITVDITTDVKINDATVTTPDIEADNGVVHVIDGVLIPETSSVKSINAIQVKLYPNPANSFVTIPADLVSSDFIIVDMAGRTVQSGTANETQLNIASLSNGVYFIRLVNNNLFYGSFIKE